MGSIPWYIWLISEMRSSSSPYFSWTRSPQNRIFHLFIIAKHKHQDFTRCKSVNLILLGNQTSIFSGHGMHYLSGTWVVGGTAVAAARAMRPQLPRVELRLGSHHLSFSLGDMEVWWWVHYYHIHDYSLLLSSWWWWLLLLLLYTLHYKHYLLRIIMVTWGIQWWNGEV